MYTSVINLEFLYANEQLHKGKKWGGWGNCKKTNNDPDKVYIFTVNAIFLISLSAMQQGTGRNNLQSHEKKQPHQLTMQAKIIICSRLTWLFWLGSG